MSWIFIFFQYISPHHLLSRTTGRLARMRSPKWLKNIAISAFARYYGVSMEEAGEPDIRRYASFNDFFTRALRPGARPIGAGDILCPADGTISQVGQLAGGRVLQAKGRYYSVVELLGGDAGRADCFLGGAFATVYLAPRDYHRVHMPLAGRLTATTYIPGKLFSVNALTAARVDRLFARNERLVCYFDTSIGPMAMVLVGAMIVAGIETVWAGQVAPPPRAPLRLDYLEAPEPVELGRGEEMGRFFLGSTVILLFPRDCVTWRDNCRPGTVTRVGEALGDFTA